MGDIASQITSLAIVYPTVYSGTDQRKHQSSEFVWGIHRRPVNSPHKWPVTRKISPFGDVIMLREIDALQRALQIVSHRPWRFNILRSGDIYIRQLIRQLFVQVIACLTPNHFLGWSRRNKFKSNLWELKHQGVTLRKRTRKCHLINGGHFVSVSKC